MVIVVVVVVVFIVRPLLTEPGPQVHYKSQPNAETPRKTPKKSTNVKKLD